MTTPRQSSSRIGTSRGDGPAEPGETLRFQAENALAAFRALTDAARDQTVPGSDDAAGALLSLLTRFTLELQQLCADSPERFREWARRQPFWPILYHLHRERQAEIMALLDDLNLGRDHDLNYQSGKQFSLETATNRAAKWTYEIAVSCRDDPPRSRCIGVVGLSLTAEQKARFERWYTEVAPSLPDRLTRENSSVWRKQTHELFLLLHGDEFQDHHAFRATTQGVREVDKHGRLARAARRATIRRALRDAWISIAKS